MCYNAGDMGNPIEIKDLKFAYDQRRPILRGVSVSIPRGGVVAIMGGSGSGKTTLLRNICGQERPIEGDGSVEVMGYDMAAASVNDLYHLRKRIGMLFQFGGLFTDMSVLGMSR